MGRGARVRGPLRRVHHRDLEDVMQLIPFNVSEDMYHIFVALEDKNLERMKAYDPAQFSPLKLPAEWQDKTLGMVIIGYATAKDLAQVRSLIDQGASVAALEFLSRGFAFKPK